MSMIIVHLRWNGVGAEERARLREVLPEDERRPAGCLSRAWRCEARAVLGTEVWRSEDEVHRFHALLPAVLAGAGLGQPSHVTAFALPSSYAHAYEQSRRAAPVPAPVLPVARTPMDDGATQELARSS
jgi:hypothetical protein